jgi:hypothetical protein
MACDRKSEYTDVNSQKCRYTSSLSRKVSSAIFGGKSQVWIVDIAVIALSLTSPSHTALLVKAAMDGTDYATGIDVDNIYGSIIHVIGPCEVSSTFKFHEKVHEIGEHEVTLHVAVNSIALYNASPPVVV